MEKLKMKGKIKWYNSQKHHGYIIAGDSENYLFELIDCLNPNDLYEVGEEVLFIPNYNFGINVAQDVEKTKKLKLDAK